MGRYTRLRGVDVGACRSPSPVNPPRPPYPDGIISLLHVPMSHPQQHSHLLNTPQETFLRADKMYLQT